MGMMKVLFLNYIFLFSEIRAAMFGSNMAFWSSAPVHALNKINSNDSILISNLCYLLI